MNTLSYVCVVPGLTGGPNVDLVVLEAEPGPAGADYVVSGSVLSIWPLGMWDYVDRQLLGGAQSTLCKDASSGTY